MAEPEPAAVAPKDLVQKSSVSEASTELEVWHGYRGQGSVRRQPMRAGDRCCTLPSLSPSGAPSPPLEFPVTNATKHLGMRDLPLPHPFDFKIETLGRVPCLQLSRWSTDKLISTAYLEASTVSRTWRKFSSVALDGN
ncbi:Tropomodulin-3 [Manis pentadactyla]|nr:Tropomodulin-3 [Manis pentadactyla]